MIIKDLEISKELSRKELSAVRGGATSIAGGQFILAGGPTVGSPVFAVNAPNANATDANPITLVSLKSANVLGSLGTFVLQ